MRVLPRVVIGALIAGAALTGCSKFDAALGQRQALVTFSGNTPDAARLHIRAACARPPAVTAAPLPSGVPLSYALQQITYTISNASDAQIAGLTQCLSKFPGVDVTLQDSSDEGA